MRALSLSDLRGRVDELQVELGDLAFHLEQRGRFDAADLAASVAARLREICDQPSAVSRTETQPDNDNERTHHASLC